MPFLAGAWTWFTNNKWAQYLAVFALAFLGMKRWEYNIRKGVERQEREKFDRMQLEEQAQMEKTHVKLNQENARHAEDADQAVRDMPRYRATDELRRSDPGLGEIVLGSSDRSS